jgi:hypothetical protein
MPFSPEEERELQRQYRAGEYTPEEMARFERSFPHLVSGRGRTTEEMLAIEGGGLQERIGPLGLAAGAAAAPLRAGASTLGVMAGVMEPASQIAEDLSQEVGLRLGGQARPTLTGGQVAAESALGIGGALGGTALAGRPGGALGAAGGTFLGGVLAGRRPMDALLDAAQQGGLEYLSSGLGAMASRALVPPVSPASRQALESGQAAPAVSGMWKGGPRPTQAEFGRETLGAMKEEFTQAQDIVGKAYAKAKQQIPGLDIRHIVQRAEELGLRLPRTGAEIQHLTLQGPPTTTPGRLAYGQAPGSVGAVIPPTTTPGPALNLTAVDIDDAIKIRHLLGEQSRGLRRSGDAVQAAAVEQVHRLLAKDIEQAASSVGALPALKAADKFFGKQIAERFQNETVQKIMQTAGRQIIEEMSPERLSGFALKGTLDDADQITGAIKRLTNAYPDALPTFRAGIVGALLESSVDPRTGVIRPDMLLRQLSTPRMQPEVLNTLLSPEVASGLKEFARNYSKATTRGALAVGAVGEAATLATAGTLGPGAMVGAGLEVANELNMLGRMFVRSPTMSKRLVATVLGNQEEAARKITGLRTLRIVGTQALGAGLGAVVPGGLPGLAEQGLEALGMQFPRE